MNARLTQLSAWREFLGCDTWRGSHMNLVYTLIKESELGDQGD